MIIEKIILDYLKKETKLPVYPEVPTNAPKKFIVFEKTAGSRNKGISTAMIAIQSYAETLLDTALLNDKIIDVMERITELDEISKCDLNSNYNYTDTETKKYRYQAVFDITYFN